MVVGSAMVSFYLMEKSREFSPGRPPQNPKEQAEGLSGAIEATKKRIAEYRAANADVSDLETHLKNLEKRLKLVKKT